MNAQETIAMRPNAFELYLRPSSQEGIWMACGFAAVSASPVEAIWNFAMPAGSDVFRQMASRPMPEDEWGVMAVTDHAQLVTQSIWQRFKNISTPYLQLALRPIEAAPGLASLCGLLQDDKDQASRGWNRDFGTLLRGSLRPEYGHLHLQPVETDLQWTRGLNLSQVQKEPTWQLGAEEPWAPRWLLAPEATRAARRACELRRLMVMGEASAEQEETFTEANRACGQAVHKPGQDELFDELQRELIRRGDGPDEQAVLVSASEARRQRQVMDEVLRQVISSGPGF